ncbi:MAG: hypothetical protein NVSMB14_06910 [Isosphaeraceae bacterium]
MRPIASIFVGVLALVALSTTAESARGACVHGVSVSSRLDREGNHSRGGARHFELLRQAGALVERSEETPLFGSEGSPNCSGPFCSNGSPVPLAPVLADPPRPPQWAGLIGIPVATPISSNPLPLDADSPGPTHIAPAVFHPPRLVSLPLAIVPA